MRDSAAGIAVTLRSTRVRCKKAGAGCLLYICPPPSRLPLGYLGWSRTQQSQTEVRTTALSESTTNSLTQGHREIRTRDRENSNQGRQIFEGGIIPLGHMQQRGEGSPKETILLVLRAVSVHLSCVSKCSNRSRHAALYWHPPVFEHGKLS